MTRLIDSFLRPGVVLLAGLALCGESRAQIVGSPGFGVKGGMSVQRPIVSSGRRFRAHPDAIVSTGRFRPHPDAIVSTKFPRRHGKARPMAFQTSPIVGPVVGDLYGAAFGGFGWGYNPYGFEGFSGGAYSSGRIGTPPYFALHPPVYYDFPPVPRSYGHSPFAYPGYFVTPEPAVPAEIINPHVTPAEPEAKDASLKTAKLQKTQVLWNPYTDAAIDGFVRDVESPPAEVTELQLTQEQPQAVDGTWTAVDSESSNEVIRNPFTAAPKSAS